MAKHRAIREPVVQPQDQSIRYIPLTKGQVAVVSVEDYERLSEFKWQAYWSSHSHSFYATRRAVPGDNLPPGKSMTIGMHRDVLGLVYGDGKTADHKSHDTLDNRRENLRPATRSQNQHNRAVTRRSTTGYKGVFFNKRRNSYHARIMVNKREHYLGAYDSAEQAHAAYCAAAEHFHGEFSGLNQPSPL